MQQNSHIIYQESTTDYKKNYINIFKNELILFIEKQNDNERKLSEEKEYVEKALSGKVYLVGELFYDFWIRYKFDFEAFCKKVFASSKAYKLNLFIDSENPLLRLLNPLLNSQSKFYEASDIEKTRFSRIIKSNKPYELYADEIYGIATALNIEKLNMFKYFYMESNQSEINLILQVLQRGTNK